MGERLTEKRMEDRRFRKTEEAILKAFFEGGGFVSIGVMAEKAGVARSTFYRHHKAVRMIVPDYKRFILNRYKRNIGSLMKKRISLRTLLLRIPVFIIANKHAFKLLCRNGDKSIIRDMVFYLKPKILKAACLPENHETIFKVYVGEVVELIDCWMKDECEKTEMEKLVSNIEYLTETMRTRLLPIEKVN